MSFDIIKFLEDPPKFNSASPEQFEQHYRELTDFCRQFFNKQRQLGYGITYDSQDRAHVPLSWLWLHQ